MTGALEFAVGDQPVGRAAQVRADGGEGVDAIIGTDNPDRLRLLEALIDFVDLKIAGETDLEALWRFKQHIGEQESDDHRQEPAGRRRKRNPADGQPGEKPAALYGDRGPTFLLLDIQCRWWTICTHSGPNSAIQSVFHYDGFTTHRHSTP